MQSIGFQLIAGQRNNRDGADFMAKFVGILLGLLLVASLAACSGMPVIAYTYVSDSYRPQELSYAAARGGMLTEVTGNPFDAPKAALDSTVTTAMEQAHFGPELAFFTEPPEGYSSAYRVVVLFNPALSANGAKLCSSPERPQEERAQEERLSSVGVLASLCSSDTRINTAGGSLTGATGPDDPAFERFMRQLSLELFPLQSPFGRDPEDISFF